jgi:Tfp pilus assembly protein PilZ
VSERLKLHLLEREDFYKYFDEEAGGFFVPGADPPNIGTKVTLEVIFQAGPRVLLGGTVIWRRPSGDSRTRPGTGVTVDPIEHEKIVYLLGFVRGGLIDIRKRRRMPVRLRVAYSSTQGRRMNFTRDFHEDGAFVRAAELLPVGSTTTLTISPPGRDYRPLTLAATVTRQQTEGDRGIGVRFEFRNEEERAVYSAFFARLEADYLDGKLPDEVLI